MFSLTAAHYIFFGVFFSAALPVLYYYRRRNPDPRFRPHAGEMAMITLFALFICGGLALGLGSLFQEENDGRSAKKRPDEGAGWSQGMSTGGGQERRESRPNERKSGSSGRERGGFSGDSGED